MNFKQNGAGPAYRQVADAIIREIDSGLLAPGEKLPALRALAEREGLSLGTAKHVYDVLEREGRLVKIQGRGTFVHARQAPSAGDKAQAMAAIDGLLDELRALSFSLRDIRIFLDLKLRAREAGENTVRVGAVDCSPEALAMMREQIAALPRAEVDSYPLEAVLSASGPFAPPADLIVTTTTHRDDLAEKMPAGREPVCLVMSLATETAVALAAIAPDTRVGVVCKSPRFAQIILAACAKYCRLARPPRVAFHGRAGQVRAVAAASDCLILAPNRHLFSLPEEEAAIAQSAPGRHILYHYQVEKGSMVYLESQIDRAWAAKQAGQG